MHNQVPPEQQERLGIRSSTGPRELNEDSAFIRDFTGHAKRQRYLCLGAVADGMGGHQAGEVASNTAIQTLFEAFSALLPGYGDIPSAKTEDLLFEVFSSVNSTVYDIAIRDNKLRGMGTTLTAFLAEEGQVFFAHVGDSRAYLVRGGSITQLTEDHTLVESMVKERIISREEAAARSDRNVITRAIGVESSVGIDLFSIPVLEDDIILLCSDGLYGPVTLQDTLITLNGPQGMQAACDTLVDLAIREGASDNVTVLLWRVPAPAGVEPAATTVILAPSRTNTLALPPERMPAPAAAMEDAPKPSGRKAGTVALIIAIIAFIAIGFLVGWLIAGWIGGDDSNREQGPGERAGGQVKDRAQTADTVPGVKEPEATGVYGPSHDAAGSPLLIKYPFNRSRLEGASCLSPAGKTRCGSCPVPAGPRSAGCTVAEAPACCG